MGGRSEGREGAEAVRGGRRGAGHGGHGGRGGRDLPPRLAAVLTTLIEHLAEILRPLARAAAGLAGTYLVAEAIVEVARVAPAGALSATLSAAAVAGAGGGSVALALGRRRGQGRAGAPRRGVGRVEGRRGGGVEPPPAPGG